MAPFRFRLQRVLDYRGSLVEAQEAELARCALELRRAQEHRQQTHRRQQRLLAELAAAPVGAVRADRMACAWRYLDEVRRELERAARQVQEATAAVEAARERLAQLKKEEQVIVKLRERQHGRALLAQKRLETKEADDLTSTRHGFNQGEAR